MPDFIDPEEFPFTEDELYRAERLFAAEGDARETAATIARGGRENRVSRLAAEIKLTPEDLHELDEAFPPPREPQPLEMI